MMSRYARRKQRRSSPALAREIDLPLPLNGMFVDAKAAKVSNLYAAEMVNWRSNGVSLVLRPGITWTGEPAPIIQRVPYEFGRSPRYIEMTGSEATCDGASLSRIFGGRAMAAAISSNIIMADGIADPVRYDGSAFSNASFTTTTGADPARFDCVIAHHDRLFFWRSGRGLEFYYGDVGAVSGGLARFPLDRLGNITGSIAAMVSLTVDAGHGMNDMLCIITTTGQMVIYEGLDPGDSADWRLTGRVQAAAPVSREAFAEVGADAWMLTAQGVVSIGESLRASVMALASEITAPIAGEIMEAVEQGGGAWSMTTAADGSMVVVSRAEGLTAKQWVYYTQSRSWATADMPARDWHNLVGAPQITGFDGRLGTIKPRSSGESMTARLVTGWFETGRDTGVAWVKPTIRAQGPLQVRLVVLSDTNDTSADIAEAEQVVTVEPEEDDGGTVTLSDEIVTDAVGSRFQITLEVTAAWAELISLKAAVA